MGLDQVLTLQNFGMLPEGSVHRSMRKMAEEVLPQENAALKSRLNNPVAENTRERVRR